jgi:hypothetical protein
VYRDLTSALSDFVDAFSFAAFLLGQHSNIQEDALRLSLYDTLSAQSRAGAYARYPKLALLYP